MAAEPERAAARARLRRGSGASAGRQRCGRRRRPGAVELAAQLRSRFPQITYVSGYCCRDICRDPPTGLMSVHGTGRALDLVIPLVAGEANNAQGDEIGSWLIEHAQAIGIQLIVWDYWSWDGGVPPGAKGQPFTAESPHTDHLHVELSVEGAERRTPWFTGGAASLAGAAGEPSGP